jgi:peroxiredoxin
MKNIKIFILIILACSLTYCGKRNSQQGYKISMDLTGFKDDTKLYLVNLDLGRAVDSTSVKNGKAQFTGVVSEPVYCRIHTGDKYLVLQLENCNIKISGSFTDFNYCKIEGSELNKVWTKARDYQRQGQTERDSLMQIIIKVMETNPDLAHKINSRVIKIDSMITQYRISLIKNEKPSFFTINELFFLRNDLPVDTLKEFFSLFPVSLQKTKYGEVIQTYIDSRKSPSIGEKFIDIEGIDIHGNYHNLSDTKGKYVLLEFWASWCGPCLGEIPNMVKAYESFKEKGFEIYSFSTDSNTDNWKKAVEKYKVPWINVIDVKGFYSIMAAKYAVRGIPKNFLISPDGIIIGVDLRGEGLHNKLKEILL